MSNEVAIRETTQPAFSMTPKTLQEAMEFSKIMANSDLVPKDYRDKPGNILVAIQKGFEIGLSPMNALESIAVINGRCALWGDGLLALVQASPVYEWIDETESTDTMGVCISKRKGHKPLRTTFSMEDAQRAGLLDKPGPWKQYRPRMLKLRARGFNLRDNFADVTKGMIPAEEAMDIQPPAPLTPYGEELVKQKTLPLKDKLKAQVEEQAAPAEPVASEAPSKDDPMDPDVLIQDYRARIQGAISVAEATALYNQAADLGCFLKSHLDGLRIAMDARIKELGGKKR